MTAHHRRRQAQIFEARVGAGADEDAVDRDRFHRRARLERHVGKRPLIGLRCRIRHAPTHRHGLPGIGAPGHVRFQPGGVDRNFLVEVRAGIRRQRLPVRDRLLPPPIRRRMGPPFHVGKRRLVGCHHPRARAALDRHVADRHAPFHRQIANRRPAVLDDMAAAAVDADSPNDAERHVLGGDAQWQRSLDGHRHRLRPALAQALGGEDVLDL